MTIEPRPAGPTFARCALQGAHAGPNGLPMDTNIIYIYIYIYIYYIYATVHAERDHKSAKKNIFSGFPTDRPFPAFVPNLLRIGRCVAEIRLLLFPGVGKLTSPKRQFLYMQYIRVEKYFRICIRIRAF